MQISRGLLINDPLDLAAALRQAQLFVEVRTGSTIHHLAQFIAAGETVILWSTMEGGHYVVLQALGESGITAMDPWPVNPRYHQISWAEFLTHWTPNGLAIRSGKFPLKYVP